MTVHPILLKAVSRLRTSQSIRRWLFYAGGTLAVTLSIVAVRTGWHGLYWLIALPMAIGSAAPIVLSFRTIRETAAPTAEQGET